MEDNENPYITMPVDVLTKHLEQISSIVKEKSIDVSQMFGVSISAEDEKKIAGYETLEKQVETLNTAASSKDLTVNELALAQSSIHRLESDIKGIDSTAPIGTILSSKFNGLEKLEILNLAQGIVAHYTDKMTVLKAELETTNKAVNAEQQFGAPAEVAGKAEEIVADIMKTYAPEITK